MDVLVTGATGFIGGHVAEVLSARGDRVGVLVRDDAARNLPAYLSRTLVHPGDLADPTSLSCVSGYDTVIHSAALMGNFDYLSKDDFYRINVDGTRLLLEACHRHGVRHLIHISTIGVSGGRATDEALNEESPYGENLSKYEWSKMLSEKVVREWMVGGSGNPKITILRPPLLFGPRMLYGWPQILANLARGKMKTIGPGESKIQVIYVLDLVDIILKCLGNPKAEGQTFITAPPDVTTLRTYFTAIAHEMGVPPPGTLPYWPVYLVSILLQAIPYAVKPGDLKLLTPNRVRAFREHRVFDVSKLSRVLGVTAFTPTSEAIRRTLAWYRENGYLTAPSS